MSKASDYICSVPFTSLEVQEHSNFLCCASWLLKYLPKSDSLLNSWNSNEAVDIRNSILDGSYRYCDDKQCPFLSQIETEGNRGVDNPLVHRSNIPKHIANKIDNHLNNTLLPEVVQFSFDRTCNLKCPSCRIDFITSSGKTLKKVQATIEEIENTLARNIRTLYITGSGDPFTSPSFRKFLRNFDPNKYPKLKRIHLHTNATKWDKKMWDSMKSIHPFVKSCEISIDAGTKNTYENITRIGGNWDELIDNLHFIATITSLKKIKTSFVVQESNFKEMKIFYDKMYSIFGSRVLVFYGKINNWGTFTEEEFTNQKIWDTKHPRFLEFIDELNTLLPRKNTLTNMQEFLREKSKLF
jgi:sulfatase maturation enzyme AslB (radical SAM superfamily)